MQHMRRQEGEVPVRASLVPWSSSDGPQAPLVALADMNTGHCSVPAVRGCSKRRSNASFCCPMHKRSAIPTFAPSQP
jgi:hypothetical protein